MHSPQHATESTKAEISPVVTFRWKCHQSWHFYRVCISPFLQCNNQCKKGTLIISPSKSSWHISSRMNAFTSADKTVNHNINITSRDISSKVSPVVTFSHNMHFSLSAMQQSTQNRYSYHPSISIQLTHPFTAESSHLSMLFIQPEKESCWS